MSEGEKRPAAAFERVPCKCCGKMIMPYTDEDHGYMRWLMRMKVDDPRPLFRIVEQGGENIPYGVYVAGNGHIDLTSAEVPLVCLWWFPPGGARVMIGTEVHNVEAANEPAERMMAMLRRLGAQLAGASA